MTFFSKPDLLLSISIKQPSIMLFIMFRSFLSIHVISFLTNNDTPPLFFLPYNYNSVYNYLYRRDLQLIHIAQGFDTTDHFL